MRYDDPVLIDALAREYVLGTLRGRARRRFEELLSTSMAARDRVDAWEDHLEALDDIAPVAPPGRVGRRLANTLGLTRQRPGGAIEFDDGGGAQRDTSPGGRRGGVRNRPGPVWAAAAALAIATSALGSWYLGEYLRAPTERLEPAVVSIVTTAEGEDVWAVLVYPDLGEVAIAVTGEVPVIDDSVYELWVLPEGSPPRSLGLLPVRPAREIRSGVSAAVLADLGRASRLAVSIEPPGGSPVGEPTGDVVFVSSVAAR